LFCWSGLYPDAGNSSGDLAKLLNIFFDKNQTPYSATMLQAVFVGNMTRMSVTEMANGSVVNSTFGLVGEAHEGSFTAMVSAQDLYTHSTTNDIWMITGGGLALSHLLSSTHHPDLFHSWPVTRCHSTRIPVTNLPIYHTGRACKARCFLGPRAASMDWDMWKLTSTCRLNVEVQVEVDFCLSCEVQRFCLFKAASNFVHCQS
jgi:hypothetical protein